MSHSSCDQCPSECSEVMSVGIWTFYLPLALHDAYFPVESLMFLCQTQQ